MGGSTGSDNTSGAAVTVSVVQNGHGGHFGLSGLQCKEEECEHSLSRTRTATSGSSGVPRRKPTSTTRTHGLLTTAVATSESVAGFVTGNGFTAASQASA